VELGADWPEDQTEAAAQQQNGGESSKHLWDESWDDDDTSDDFSQQLKYDHLYLSLSYLLGEHEC
jgi:26 proteasome complex subunit DSS1